MVEMELAFVSILAALIMFMFHVMITLGHSVACYLPLQQVGFLNGLVSLCLNGAFL